MVDSYPDTSSMAPRVEVDDIIDTYGPAVPGVETLLEMQPDLLLHLNSTSIPSRENTTGRIAGVQKSSKHGTLVATHWIEDRDGIPTHAVRAFTLEDINAVNQPHGEVTGETVADVDPLEKAEVDEEGPSRESHPEEVVLLEPEEEVTTVSEEATISPEATPSSEAEEALVNAYDMLLYLARSTSGSPHERDANIVDYVRTMRIEDAQDATPTSRVLLEAMAAGIVRDPAAVEEASRSFLTHFNAAVTRVAHEIGGTVESNVRNIEQQLHNFENAWNSGCRVPIEEAHIRVEQYLSAIDSESEPLMRTALVCGVLYTGGMLQEQGLHISKRLADPLELSKLLRLAL